MVIKSRAGSFIKGVSVDVLFLLKMIYGQSSGQSYKTFTLVNYDSRVVPD